MLSCDIFKLQFPLSGGQLLRLFPDTTSDIGNGVKNIEQIFQGLNLGGNLILLDGIHLMSHTEAALIVSKVVPLYSTVAVFEPSQDEYVIAISNSPKYSQGDTIPSEKVKPID
jgi:hypothetical protein